MTSIIQIRGVNGGVLQCVDIYVLSVNPTLYIVNEFVIEGVIKE